MHIDDAALHFDPRFEDPQELRRITRRGFFRRLIGGTAAGAALLSFGSNAFGAAAPPLNSLGRGATPDDERYWELVAGQFLIRKGLTYMNTGTRGPSPRSVHMAQIEAMVGIDSDYSGYTENAYNKDYRAELRNKMAAFLGVKTTEVAFTNNTTEGMVFGTFGPDLKRGDEIIYTNHDHSGGAHPILLRAAREGLAVKVIDLSDRKFHPPKSPDDLLKAFETAITPKTKLLSFCHINYTDGGVLPVKDICAMARAKGVLTLVDGAQTPGMMALDLHDLGCDMYAGPSHKWMMASMYTGFFYVREGIQDRVWPTLYAGLVNGKNMYGREPAGDDANFYKKETPGLARFELRGSSHYPARVSIGASLDFHNHLTREAVEARDRYLAQRLHKGLRAIDGVDLYTSDDPRLGCAIVAFTVKGVPTKTVNDLLWDRHVIYIRKVTHPEIGWDVNRASMHLMVTVRQVDTLIGAIQEIATQKPS
ncbi:MAG: aminotransferase class V-fold PLP-dependent enzyme [Candidatus Latescibacteria bacterium]|nr:aminotransferase class V-fold PLP-dependent enzyme [Candidatus Latescibacterota bacterium]